MTAGEVLQRVVGPDPAVAFDPALYARPSGGAGWDGARWRLPRGGGLAFDSYMNLFNLGRWQAAGGIRDLALTLRGQGRVRLAVTHLGAKGARAPLMQSAVDLSRAPALPLPRPAGRPGLLALSLVAETDAALDAAAFVTPQPPPRRPRLALSVTTFRREAQVRRTAARIAGWIAAEAPGGDVHLFVVDNGDSADIEPGPHVTRVPNRNLGGAGGFARGLAEARAGGFSHVIFMDDDAAVHLEALARTRAFLAHARDPAQAVAGALITLSRPAEMWEAGATFDGRCMPRWSGTDLADPAAVAEMEGALTAPPPRNLYGGWWFFAFPVAAVRHDPFPFFVRGDDVSFSLANPFAIATLNGVASLAEDFFAKESPLTWYLDLRSHLAHHLSLPALERGRWRVARIAVWFFLRNAIRFHYDSMAAILLALEDVLRGPEAFEEDIDLARRRADIAALTRVEAWRPVAELDLTERHRFAVGKGWKWRLFRWTGNGHLLPFFGLWGNRAVVPAEARAGYALTWGAARLTMLNPAGDRGYTVAISRRRLLRLGARLARLLLRFVRHYPRLRDRYRTRYPEMTAPAFWQRQLGAGR